MNGWSPTVGEHAYAITTDMGQCTSCRRVTITEILKTRIKTDGGNFSIRKTHNDSFEQHPAPQPWASTCIYLHRSGSTEATDAIRVIQIARYVHTARRIGLKLSSLPRTGEGADDTFADSIEQLQRLRLDLLKDIT